MGIIASLISGSFPPKPTYSADQVPDLTGKVIIVTGGNAGLGKETVKVCRSSVNLQENALTSRPLAS